MQEYRLPTHRHSSCWVRDQGATEAYRRSLGPPSSFGPPCITVAVFVWPRESGRSKSAFVGATRRIRGCHRTRDGLQSTLAFLDPASTYHGESNVLQNASHGT